jgi:mannose-6-phosphate isomerase-like protein (cupin superfamily)
LKDVYKYLLVGSKDQAKNFELRYFLFEPGSQSDLTRHDKKFVFFILHGKANMQINNEFFDLKPQDVVNVSERELIQFMPIDGEALGFICVTTPPKNSLYAK